MVKITLCAVGAEGLGNISVYQELGCLKNGMLDKDMVTQSGSFTWGIADERGPMTRTLLG